MCCEGRRRHACPGVPLSQGLRGSPCACWGDLPVAGILYLLGRRGAAPARARPVRRTHLHGLVRVLAVVRRPARLRRRHLSLAYAEPERCVSAFGGGISPHQACSCSRTWPRTFVSPAGSRRWWRRGWVVHRVPCGLSLPASPQVRVRYGGGRRRWRSGARPELEVHADIVGEGRVAAAHHDGREEQLALVDQPGLDCLGREVGTADGEVAFRRAFSWRTASGSKSRSIRVLALNRLRASWSTRSCRRPARSRAKSA